VRGELQRPILALQDRELIEPCGIASGELDVVVEEASRQPERPAIDVRHGPDVAYVYDRRAELHAALVQSHRMLTSNLRGHPVLGDRAGARRERT